jgi:lipopolysaccharide transport system permease protein
LEILPWVALGAATFHALISLSVWLIAYTLFFGMPHPTVLLLPLIMLPLIFFIMGLTWWLASLGVFLRDVSQFVGIFVTILMFLSPIFYPASALPDGLFRHFLILNPITAVVEQVRDVMFWGKLPNLGMLANSFIIGITTAWLGFVWFQKTRKGFADVI